MDEGVVRQYAKCQALMAEIEAINIEVIAMRIANSERSEDGEANAYSEDDFLHMANAIRAVAKQLAEGV